MWHLICMVIFSFLTLSESYGTYNSQSQAGSIFINSFGEISCDDLICPKDSFKCRIERVSIPNTRNIEISRTCFGRDGTVLAEDKKMGLAPYEGFNSIIEGDLNGVFITDGSSAWTPEQAAEFNEHIQKQTQEVVNQVAFQTQNIQQQVHDQLNQVFSNLNQNFGFPFFRRG